MGISIFKEAPLLGTLTVLQFPTPSFWDGSRKEMAEVKGLPNFEYSRALLEAWVCLC